MCLACDDGTSTLAVHHLKYYSQPWDAPLDHLQTLCESCHAALGPHPKAGVWWDTTIFEDLPTGNTSKCVGFAFAWCPLCGGDKITERVICFSCGHIIMPKSKHGIVWGKMELPEELPI